MRQGSVREKRDRQLLSRILSEGLSPAAAPRLSPQERTTPLQQGLMAPQPFSLRTSFRALSITRIEIKESVIYTTEGDGKSSSRKGRTQWLDPAFADCAGEYSLSWRQHVVRIETVLRISERFPNRSIVLNTIGLRKRYRCRRHPRSTHLACPLV